MFLLALLLAVFGPGVAFAFRWAVVGNRFFRARWKLAGGFYVVLAGTILYMAEFEFAPGVLGSMFFCLLMIAGPVVSLFLLIAGPDADPFKTRPSGPRGFDVVLPSSISPTFAPNDPETPSANQG